tara:strand:+ start:78 stop:395 length:318 start_codon:yes stop_codon:yes gene_type:complete
MRLIKDTALDILKAIEKANVKYNKQALGMTGAKYVKGAGQNLGNWFAIQGVDAAVLDVSLSTFKANMVDFTGATDIAIPNGSIIYVNASDIQLASGNAILYKAHA